MAGHDRLTKEGERFFKEMAELKRLSCRVGYKAGEAVEPSGADVADVALFNEFGTYRIPARPFLRDSVDNNAGKIETVCKAQLESVAHGKSAAAAFAAIYEMQAALIRDTIAGGGFAPNAESTVAKKHSSKPLIDTGTMMQSVGFEIRAKGGE